MNRHDASGALNAEDPVAIIDAAARRAWRGLLCYFLRVALTARERS